MNRYLKYTLIALAGATALFVLLVAAASLLLDPNDYKPRIVQMVKEKKQRNLTLAGDIKLAFFPKLGLDLGRASLSEFQGEKEFAAVEGVRLYLSWLPLLKKELVVDQVRVEGVRADLVRFKNGGTNFDDLLKKDQTEEDKQIKFDISSVSITKGALSFNDEMAGRRFSASDITFKTGRLASGLPTKVAADFNLSGDKPQVKAQIHLTTGLTFNPEARRYALKELNLEIKGEAAGLQKLAMELKGDLELDQAADTLLARNLAAAVVGKKGADDIDFRLTAPKLQWQGGKIATETMDLAAKLQQAGAKGAMELAAHISALTGDRQSFKADLLTVEFNTRQPDGEYKGKLTSPLTGNFTDRQFALPRLEGNLTASNAKMAGKAMKLETTGSAQLDLKRENVSLNLTSHLDESRITMKAGLTPFTKPRLALDLDIDRLDADRYLSARPPKNQKQPDEPLDFTILKKLNADGNIRVGALKMYNIKTSNLRLNFKAGGGKLEVAPLTADLYQGKMNGAISIEAEGPRLTARQNISGVSIGPLLKDTLAKDFLEGRGSLNFDLIAQGTTVGAMKKSLQGKAGLALRDGTVKGFNLPARLREAKNILGTLKGEKVQAANVQEQTDFSELSAGFDLKRGVAHNEDLLAKSPLLRVSGRGDIDLGGEMINYFVRATVVGSLEGQGGRELAALKGITVPVRITGPFAAAKVSLDFNALVRESVKEEIKSRAIDKVNEGLQRLFR